MNVNQADKLLHEAAQRAKDAETKMVAAVGMLTLARDCIGVGSSLWLLAFGFHNPVLWLLGLIVMLPGLCALQYSRWKAPYLSYCSGYLDGVYKEFKLWDEAMHRVVDSDSHGARGQRPH